MKRLIGTIKRGSQDSEIGALNGDSPEATIARGIRLFCESGGPNNQGEEVLHLPVIVEAAESSPSAAREAATRIRKFLAKENFQRAYVQYNAIMLVRILSDNPGKSFTKNIDSKFVITVKELLRDGRDMSVQQILRETLDNFETVKAEDETLAALVSMWKKNKVKYAKNGVSRQLPPRPTHASTWPPQSQSYPPNPSRNHRPRGLPAPHELAQRIEEARTSSKLLMQVVQSTPPHEVLNNELIKEFVERCQSASRSIQTFINSDDPPPDEDTLLTLIETNDQISTAMSKYQRAMLQARRRTNAPSPSPGPPGLQQRNGSFVQEMPVNNNSLQVNGGSYGSSYNSSRNNSMFSSPAPQNNSMFSPPPPTTTQSQNGSMFASPSPQQTNGLYSPPSSPPPSRLQHLSTPRKPVPQRPLPTQSRQDSPNLFDNPQDHHPGVQAPADFGLPPSGTDNAPPASNTRHSGYHPRPQASNSYGYMAPHPDVAKGEGRRETRVESSDDDDDDDDGDGRRGRAVQYRF